MFAWKKPISDRVMVLPCSYINLCQHLNFYNFLVKLMLNLFKWNTQKCSILSQKFKHFSICLTLFITIFNNFQIFSTNYFITVQPHRWCNGWHARLEGVDLGVEPRSGQIKDYKIGICYFFTKHTALRRKSKDWLARNQENVSEWGDMSIRGLLFQWASTIKSYQGCWSHSLVTVHD